MSVWDALPAGWNHDPRQPPAAPEGSAPEEIARLVLAQYHRTHRAPSVPPDARYHVCSGETCSLARDPAYNAYVCEQSHLVHLCGRWCNLVGAEGVCTLTGLEVRDTRISEADTSHLDQKERETLIHNTGAPVRARLANARRMRIRALDELEVLRQAYPVHASATPALQSGAPPLLLQSTPLLALPGEAHQVSLPERGSRDIREVPKSMPAVRDAILSLVSPKAVNYYVKRSNIMAKAVFKGLKKKRHPNIWEYCSAYERHYHSLTARPVFPPETITRLSYAIAVYLEDLAARHAARIQSKRARDALHITMPEYTIAVVVLLRDGWSFRGTEIFPRVPCLQSIPDDLGLGKVSVRCRKITKARGDIRAMATTATGLAPNCRFPRHLL